MCFLKIFFFFFNYLRKLITEDGQCHDGFSSFNFEGIKS